MRSIRTWQHLLGAGIVIVAFALAGCGSSSSNAGNTGGGGSGSGNTVTDSVQLTQTDFAQKQLTTKVGTSFKFVDPSDTGGYHIICTGNNGTCAANPDAPKDLAAPGFTIQAGQDQSVTFDKPGDYQLTCTVHPNMNLTLRVVS